MARIGMRARATLAALAMAGWMASDGLGQGIGPTEREVEFPRFAAKNPESLAKKAGGPTERIEVQSTEDHIDYVVKAYTLQHANASEVFGIIQNAVALEGGFVDRLAAGSAVDISPAGDVNTSYEGTSILVVTAPEWMIPFVDQTIAVLDQPGLESSAFGTGYAYYRPKHRRPSELAELLAGSVASGFEVLVPDDSRNTLYLEDTPSYVGGFVEALEAFDRSPDQVEVHVRIYELDDTCARDVGLDWYAWKKSVAGGGLNFVWGKPGDTNLNLESLTGALALSPTVATEFLNYQAERGNAKVITDTRVRVVNGQTAVVDSTTQIPYVIRGWVGGTVGDQPLLDSPPALDGDGIIKEFTEGVSVELTPTIGQDSMEMQISATVASHVGYTPNQSVPIISSSSVSSVLDLSDGTPAVISGLTRTTKVEERVGIAGLKEIPGVRYLFSREVVRNHVGHVLISIVPVKVTCRDVPGDDPATLPFGGG